MNCQILRMFTIAVVAGCGVAQAEVVEIDFNELALGVVLTDQYAAQGVVFGLVGGIDAPAGPMTVEFPNNDYSPAGGIMLAPTDDNTNSDNWYDMEFTFAGGIDWFSMLALDADEAVSARAYMGNVLVDTISFGGGGNLQVFNMELGGIGGAMFDRVVIDLVTVGNIGPEVYDNLSYNPIPTPGTLALGVAALCVSGRRRRS